LFPSRDLNSREISFPGLEAQIPGLVQVSIWTVVIRLANRQQRVVKGLSPGGGYLGHDGGSGTEPRGHRGRGDAAESPGSVILKDDGTDDAATGQHGE